MLKDFANSIHYYVMRILNLFYSIRNNVRTKTYKD